MKLVISFLLLVCMFSCKEKEGKSTENNQDNTSFSISKKMIQNLNYTDFILDSKVEKITQKWAKYNELEAVILNLKQADLSYFKDNHEFLEALINDLKQTIPDKVNSPAIMSRLIALETKLYKLESVVNLSNSSTKVIVTSIKEVLVSFSNLNLQMNKKIERESQKIKKP
ncbi:hypothetical protein [Xanthomarina spongicola]|uniref:Uncharacterized protein n=1 Tax=Xanthomarina spongicola TaxID=570520 RepID=A0A316DR57_9FLAO|nr:hypothetical protein [Xanthomarina spongicola]PWK20747.1 hypothetical protein LX78_00450 [Xanthomarina spongicola]